MINERQLRQFREEGFVIVPGVAPALLPGLREAAGRVVAKGRSGEWHGVRKCGDNDIWGVSNLMDPVLGEPIFADYMASPEVLDTCAALLPGEPLRLSLTNMLVNPLKADYQIGWHRDAGNPSQTPADELAMLNAHQLSVQWNAALYPEACLRFVPGSHRRPLADEEKRRWASDPLSPMPGELRVTLAAGEAVYYNALGLHKGDYPTRTRRETLHANLVSLNAGLFGGHYHWVKFMEAPGFGESLPPALRPLHARWLTYAARIKASEAKS